MIHSNTNNTKFVINSLFYIHMSMFTFFYHIPTTNTKSFSELFYLTSYDNKKWSSSIVPNKYNILVAVLQLMVFQLQFK